MTGALIAMLPCSTAAAYGPAKPVLIAYRNYISQGNGAACLDGSAPTYYVMPGEPDKFYLHMEGGGWCISLSDCAKRARSATGTSQFDGPTTNLQGMVDGWGAWYLSNDTARKPALARMPRPIHRCTSGHGESKASCHDVPIGRVMACVVVRTIGYIPVYACAMYVRMSLSKDMRM